MSNRYRHHNGQAGRIGSFDGNGFGLFYSDTGTRYTVHKAEVMSELPTARERSTALERWASWPIGSLHFKVEQGKHGAGKVFIVAHVAPGAAA